MQPVILLLQQVFTAALSQCDQCSVYWVSCGYQGQKICPSAAKGSSSSPFLGALLKTCCFTPVNYTVYSPG